MSPQNERNESSKKKERDWLPRNQVYGNWDPNDEIVIAGMSGRFPESDNVEEFMKNLYEGVDMIIENDRRWPKGLCNLPGIATLKDASRFDATYFGVPPKLADVMDPQLRIILEVTYEALIDAGMNPSEVRGTNTGVYYGVGVGDSDTYWSSSEDRANGYAFIGSCKSMFANRISFQYDFTGPSFVLDAGCATSLVALNQAINDIRVCRVDSAIVCSSHLMLNPFYSQHLSKLGVLSPEMKSRVFDANATGFVRGEAAVALYLVRKSTARRSYASIVHVRNNTDGYKTAGVATPSGKKQYENNYALYKEAGVDPLQVGYIEAHGTGTKIGDPNELNSLTDLFCKKRSNSLLVGSLKSNMGHSECTAGLCSIVKVLLTMQTGLIPPNLNFKEPNPSVPSLFDGRVKVVEEVEILPSDYVGINAFSLGGSNSHVLMKRHEKVKNTVPSDELPRLVTVSGRTEAAVKYFLDKIDGMPQDDEFLALIHEIHKKNIQKHSYRGYTLVNLKHSTCEIAPCGEESRPVWFVCTGWGAQWLGRSKELMKFQVFERRIEVCSKVLEKEGINLYEIINNGTDLMVSEDFTKVFVTVGATQLALIDLLRSVGIKPDALVGISTGELTCAYIDGAVTAEQVMLVAYNTAQWIKESKLPAASMAVVCGLSYEEVKELCPPNIYVGVHNDAKTCTVVGPATEIPDFVNSLLKQGIVAKTVKSSAGVAFHTPLVIEESKILASTLQKIIPTSSTAKLHWISSSVTAENGRVSLVQSFNVDYFMNMVTGTVFTQEALMHIPDNAVVVEISPHSALQLTLSKVLPRSALRISLMSRDEPDQAEFLLTGLGKMYNAGIQMNLSNLYPKVSFPVSRGTPMIGPMIKWDHSAEWTIPSKWCNKKMNDDLPTNCTFQVDTTNDDSYLRGHVVNQQATYPHAGYLQLVWKAFAQVHKDWYENLPVKMENIELYETTLLPESGTLKFVVKFPHHYENSSKFELYESSRLLASGSISKLGDIREETLETFQVPNDTEQFNLTADDIYTDFRLRGVNYSGCFCSLKESDGRGTSALVEWKNNWVTFLDSLLQFAQIGAITSELYLPKRIQEIIINPNDHQKFLEAKPHEIQAQMNREVNSVKAGGVKLQGLEFYTVNRCKEEQNDPEIEKHIFIPYINKGSVQLRATVEEVRYNALTIIVQILQENTNIAVTKNILELAKELPEHELLSPSLIPVINKQPECTANIKVVSDIPEVLKQSSLLQSLNIKVEDASTLRNADCHLLIATRPSIKELSKASDILGPGEFLMLKNKLNDYDIQMPGFTVIAIQDTLDCTYVLLRKEVKFSECMVVQMTNKNYRWVEDLQEAIRTSKYYFKKVVLISQGEYDCGLLGFSACLRREIGCEKVRSVFVQDPSAPAFSCTEPLYYEQLCKDLRINIYRDGVWGSQRHIRIDLQNNAMLPVEYAQAEVINQGDANTASWVESPLKFQRAGKDEEICRICYSSVGMKDTVYLNQSTQQKKSSMGCEFSGYNSSGAPVMGIVSAGALATHVMAHRTFLWPVPTNWNLEEASTVPHVYVMSFYALLVKGRILKDEWVLIHTSENTLGQAATRICLQTGCQVIATYRTAVELQNLKNVFGNMNNLHIVLSSAIEGRVLALTAGHGVNVVFNSVELSEQSLNVMRCLAEDGRFLDTALSDLNKRNLSCMKYLQNKTYHSIQLNSLFRPTNADKEEVSRLMLEGIKSGLVIPFSAKTFSESELEKALRYAADDGSSRKVVVKILEEMDDTIRINKNKLINAIPKLYINPEKVYVLAGGMGGFGIELAKWLVNHGAKKLVLTSRRGITVGYKSLQIRRWCDAGITVITSTQDITTEDGAASLILESRKLGSIGGIFILTMVLRDALFNNQTKHNFQEVCNAKVDVAKSLDTASQRLCPELDYFVAFSSIISGRGNVGQTTYGMANSAMERICEQRHALGLPALAIQWGPIGDVGVVFNTSGNDTVLAGTVPQIIGSCLSVFEHLLRLPRPVVTSYVLWDSKTEKKNCGLERNDIISAVANVLGIKDLSSMGSSTAPDDLGIDSMMTAEIRSTLEEQFSMKMSSQQVYNLMVTTLKEQGT